MYQRAANIPKAFIHMASPHSNLGAGMDASFMLAKQLTSKFQLWLLVQRVVPTNIQHPKRGTFSHTQLALFRHLADALAVTSRVD